MANWTQKVLEEGAASRVIYSPPEAEIATCHYKTSEGIIPPWAFAFVGSLRSLNFTRTATMTPQSTSMKTIIALASIGLLVGFSNGFVPSKQISTKIQSTGSPNEDVFELQLSWFWSKLIEAHFRTS